MAINLGNGLSEHSQVQELSIIEEIAIAVEPVDQRTVIRSSVCWNGSVRRETAFGILSFGQKTARSTITDTVPLIGLLEMARYAGG